MHVQVQAIAERFKGLPEGVSKGQALTAFKQAAQPLGLSSRLRDAIDVLFAFSAPQDWQHGARPIVWPCNRKLETTLGLGRRQVLNVLSALIRAHLITPVDSPTGRCWGHRDAKTGKIVEAYGFDLSPIGLPHAEFVVLADRAAAEERKRAWRLQTNLCPAPIIRSCHLAISLPRRRNERCASSSPRSTSITVRVGVEQADRLFPMCSVRH